MQCRGQATPASVATVGPFLQRGASTRGFQEIQSQIQLLTFSPHPGKMESVLPVLTLCFLSPSILASIFLLPPSSLHLDSLADCRRYSPLVSDDGQGGCNKTMRHLSTVVVLSLAKNSVSKDRAVRSTQESCILESPRRILLIQMANSRYH